MAGRKSKAELKAEALALEQERAQQEELTKPENVAKKRTAMLARASPERRKYFEELAEVAKEPHESPHAEFSRVWGAANTSGKVNTLSRFLLWFAGEVADGRVRDFACFMRDARKKGPRIGGQKGANARQQDAQRGFPCQGPFIPAIAD